MSIQDSITQSFVYRSSTRKSAILAAASSPINTELVEQLVRYLDDEYTRPVVQDQIEQEIEAQPAADESETFGDSSSPMPTGGRPGTISDDSMSLAAMFGDDVEPEDGSPESTETEPEVLEDEPEVVDEPEIPSTTGIQSLDSIAATIATRLNVESITAGVRQTQVRDNELWVYYNDNINLDTIMEPVISEAEISNLEFNRLARSRNAIVFTAR